MSIYGSLNYGEFKTFDCEPAWSKAERYAYCEPYEPQADSIISRVLRSIRAALNK